VKRLVLIFIALFCLVAPASALAASSDSRIVVVGDVLVDHGQKTSDVVVADGDVTVRGTVDGDVIVGDGDATIRGRVTGDVVMLGGTAILGRRAVVDGDVRYADKKPQVASGAKVGGDVKKFDTSSIGTGLKIGVWVAVTISTLVIGLLLLLLFPKAADAVARTARTRTGMTVLVGVLALILLPILGIALLVTVFGIPLGAALLLAWLLLLVLAYPVAAFIVGRLILRKGARILPFVVGLLLLRALALIPIAGGIISTLAAVFGLGALLLTALRHRR
jgi:cytoskeletal protein CcmA (bactofilin family)